MRTNIKCGIYCIENTINGKKYIGQSVNIYHRFAVHKNDLNKNNHDNDHLQKSWNKYGQENFKFYILELCEASELDAKECCYIDYYNTLDWKFGYNLVSGGTFGRKLSDESRKKLSESTKLTFLNEERRRIQSENAKKQWANPEIKEKIMGKNNGNYGNHLSEESKKRISAANKGRISAKRNTTPVYCVEFGQAFNDATCAAKELDIDSSAILKVCRGERKTCGGYSWKFLNLENNIS